jgi:ATP-binding cassette, subfamily G (WHITE), member 2
MCKGKSVYYGPALTMLHYFNAQGYLCELHDNPADFALDVLNDVSEKPEDLQKLNQAYMESDMHASINSLSRKQLCDDNFERFRRKQQGVAARSLGTEVYYVSQRTLKNAIRNPQLFLSQILVAIITGLLLGLVFNDMKKTIDPGVQNRLGALFFIIISQTLCTFTALEPLLKERVLFIHVSFVFIDSIE